VTSISVDSKALFGGAGGHLHPNRLGYVAMGMTIDLALLTPAPAKAAKR
jgi:hypothetical protein